MSGILREHLAPVTGHHAVKGPVTDESWIAEVDAVPVVVSVPEVLPQRSVFNRVGGFRHLGFGDHVQVFSEQEIPRVVGQVVLVFVHFFSQRSNSRPGFFDRFRGGGGVLQNGIERLACFALFADEFDVAVEDVVLLALNDFQVAGGVARRRLEFHGLVDHEEFEVTRARHHDGVLATFVKRLPLEGHGPGGVRHGRVVVEQLGPVVVSQVHRVFGQAVDVNHERILALQRVGKGHDNPHQNRRNQVGKA